MYVYIKCTESADCRKLTALHFRMVYDIKIIDWCFQLLLPGGRLVSFNCYNLIGILINIYGGCTFCITVFINS